MIERIRRQIPLLYRTNSTFLKLVSLHSPQSPIAWTTKFDGKMTRYGSHRLSSKLPPEIWLMIWECVAALETPAIHFVPWICPRRKTHAYRKAVHRWATFIEVKNPQPSMADLRETCLIAHHVLGDRWGKVTQHNPCSNSRIAVFPKMNKLSIDLEWDIIYHNQAWQSLKGNESVFARSDLACSNVAVKHESRRPGIRCRFHESQTLPQSGDVCFRCLSDFAHKFRKLKRFYTVLEGRLGYAALVGGQKSDVLMKSPPVFEHSAGRRFAALTAASRDEKIPDELLSTHGDVAGALRDLEKARNHYVSSDFETTRPRRVCRVYTKHYDEP